MYKNERQYVARINILPAWQYLNAVLHLLKLMSTKTRGPYANGLGLTVLTIFALVDAPTWALQAIASAGETSVKDYTNLRG